MAATNKHITRRIWAVEFTNPSEDKGGGSLDQSLNAWNMAQIDASKEKGLAAPVWVFIHVMKAASTDPRNNRGLLAKIVESCAHRLIDASAHIEIANSRQEGLCAAVEKRKATRLYMSGSRMKNVASLGDDIEHLKQHLPPTCGLIVVEKHTKLLELTPTIQPTNPLADPNPPPSTNSPSTSEASIKN